MAVDNPYPRPAASVLADMCAIAAWDDHVDDHNRMLLEWAADCIREYMLTHNKQLQRCEQLEAEAAQYAALLYGPNQKGGAA